MALRFEPILTEGIAQVSYFICDESAGCAAVIDPRLDADIYLQKARQYGVTITHVFETHIHADFMSGARELATRCKGSAKLYVSIEGDATYSFEYEPVREGDEFKFGQVKIRAKHTPGHTPEHLSYLLSETHEKEPWGIMTGDSLFVDSIGRPDLLGDEKTDELTRALYNTMREVFCKLADHVIIYPCHAAGSACGPDIGDRMSSTIGYEKKHNPFMQIEGFDEFKKAIQDNAPPVPTHYPKMKKLNAKGPETFGHTPPVRALSVKEFEKEMKNTDTIIIDTRDMLAFGGGHIEGALNIGQRPILSVWAGWLIDTNAPILLILPEDKDLERVVTLLWRTGHTNFKGYLAGNMRSWQESGKQIKKLTQLSVHELSQNKGQYQPLDVRKYKEWQNGNIPDATHIFLGELSDKISTLDKEQNLAVYCASGYRASIAASLLQKNGFQNVNSIPGSFKAWKAADLPIKNKTENQKKKETMKKEIKKVNDEISVAAFDPDENSFKTFADKGFKSVINLQTDEEEQNVPPEKEEELAKDNNLEYRHIGVSEDNLSEAMVDDFRHELENLPKPIVVHCKSGKRSGAFVMIHIGCQKNMSGEEVIKQAEDMGFECDVPELEQFLKKYVNEH
ncbi:MAG TPA: MBL fold metallo-hydrolase [Leeuwenhoekiella sp.]|nr:MBL fold metallo-hydrolase [Leeuwenhoekiella sp.]